MLVVQATRPAESARRPVADAECPEVRVATALESLAEVIDVATVKPIDMLTILQSVEKTGRCIIIHEAAKTCGVGAEIAAQLAEKGLMFLLAPVQRVTGYDTVMPLYRNENFYMINTKRIVDTVNETMEFV